VFINRRRGHLTCGFAYDHSYLEHPRAYPIDPGLPLHSGTWPVDAPLPRALSDAAPDRWGRHLIARRSHADARAHGLLPPTLDEVDFLLGVSDLARQGALRCATAPAGPYLHPSTDVPKLIDLPRLLVAADAADQDGPDSDAAIRLLLEVGSASLGGARPKACVRDGGQLHIAKFPHAGDRWNVMAWEKVALDLAEQAGLAVPTRRLVRVDGRAVLVLERFDRVDGNRLGYMSALTLCGASDGDRVDYLDLADHLATISAQPTDDLAELWRRIAFGYIIHNTDDHLRNHGLLHTGRAGWGLSPAFDLNPEPGPGLHATAMAGATDTAEGLAALMDNITWFGLTEAGAVDTLRVVANAVSHWRTAATTAGVGDEISRFEAAFSEGLAAATQLIAN
jgi:serine/threonine-protein kinase HipA